MNTNNILLLLLLFLILTGQPAACAGKPRCTSFQATSVKKAEIYLGHVREFATYFPTLKKDRIAKLHEALDLIDTQFQNNPETRDLGSIIGNDYFPQSLINCIFEVLDGGYIDRLDLLESLMITELQHTKELNLRQAMNIFSSVNNMLIIFLAEFLSSQKRPADWYGSIECFLHNVFEAQRIPLKIPFSSAPKLTRAHSI